MSKKKSTQKRQHKHNEYYNSELARNKKLNKLHPRSEQSKHKRDFIDWDNT